MAPSGRQPSSPSRRSSSRGSTSSSSSKIFRAACGAGVDFVDPVSRALLERRDRYADRAQRRHRSSKRAALIDRILERCPVERNILVGPPIITGMHTTHGSGRGGGRQGVNFARMPEARTQPCRARPSNPRDGECPLWTGTSNPLISEPLISLDWDGSSRLQLCYLAQQARARPCWSLSIVSSP